MAPVSRPIVSIFSACFNARSRASCAAASSSVIGHLIRAARRRRQAECARIGGPGAQGNAMPPRPYVLNELTWKTVRDTRYDVALLPWGATEAHNFHLPYSTDNVATERIAALAAGRAWERGARVVVLPLVPFGVNTGQIDIPLCVNMNPGTQALVLRDVATALAGQGGPQLVILNGHGGNHLRQVIPRPQPPRAAVFLTGNLYQG